MDSSDDECKGSALHVGAGAKKEPGHVEDAEPLAPITFTRGSGARGGGSGGALSNVGAFPRVVKAKTGKEIVCVACLHNFDKAYFPGKSKVCFEDKRAMESAKRMAKTQGELKYPMK